MLFVCVLLECDNHSIKFKCFKSIISSCGGARCSSVVKAFAHGVMGRRIYSSWGGPIELFLVLAISPCLV